VQVLPHLRCPWWLPTVPYKLSSFASRSRIPALSPYAAAKWGIRGIHAGPQWRGQSEFGIDVTPVEPGNGADLPSPASRAIHSSPNAMSEYESRCRSAGCRHASSAPGAVQPARALPYYVLGLPLPSSLSPDSIPCPVPDSLLGLSNTTSTEELLPTPHRLSLE